MLTLGSMLAKHFVRWLLTVDEEKRPTIDEAIRHPVSPLPSLVSAPQCRRPRMVLTVLARERQWLRSAVSRPPSPHDEPDLPVFTPQPSRASSPVHDDDGDAALARKETLLEVPKMEPLGMRLSRTETVTRHAPLVEHRPTLEALAMNRDAVKAEGTA